MEKINEMGLFLDFKFNSAEEFSVFGLDVIWPTLGGRECGCTGRSYGFRIFLMGAGATIALTFTQRNPECISGRRSVGESVKPAHREEKAVAPGAGLPATPSHYRVSAEWQTGGENVGMTEYLNTLEDTMVEVQSLYNISRGGVKGSWPRIQIEPMFEKDDGNGSV